MSCVGITECRLQDSGVFLGLEAAHAAPKWNGGARVWGGRVLNMEMALIYPRPKLDYSVTSLMAQAHCVCLYQQSKGGNYLSLKLLSFLLLPGGRPGPFCSYYSHALVPFILFQIKCPSRWEEGGNSVYFILKDSSVDSDVWIRHWSADVMCVCVFFPFFNRHCWCLYGLWVYMVTNTWVYDPTALWPSWSDGWL